MHACVSLDVCVCFTFQRLFHSLTVSRTGGSTIIFHKAHDHNFSVDFDCVVEQIRLLFHLILVFTQQIWMTMICTNKLLLRLYISTVDNTNFSLVVTNIRMAHLTVCVCEQLTEIQIKLMRFLWILSYDNVTFSKISMKFCVNPVWIPLILKFYFSSLLFVFWGNNTSSGSSY